MRKDLKMDSSGQLSLFDLADETTQENVKCYLKEMLNNNRQPSGSELLLEVEKKFGWAIRWDLCNIITRLLAEHRIISLESDYLQELIDPESENSILYALNGSPDDNKVFVSTLDYLLEEGQKYKKSEAFLDMINFIARFKRYSPYNNMLVKIQNPHCSFFASRSDWATRFKRHLKEDATPMLILAPMQPVMLVYDLDSTEGEELPKELLEFAHFEGQWNPSWLQNLTENANQYLIRISYKKHSSTSAGFATIDRTIQSGKMRISIHDELDEPSKFGVLCHEMAHIFLGHLGSDLDRWWPSRRNLTHHSLEIEAEAVAFTVTQRLGLQGSSISYLAAHLTGNKIPDGVSIDLISKVAGKIEEMARGKVPIPKRKTDK
ncbi:MAG: hypothetical protein PHV71_01350 [Eubacteriales bacterium]|nr:hypothetical protein [Eubacteriales bacterium]